MQSLNSTFFANRFLRVSMATCSDPQAKHWQVAGVNWSRDRHSYNGQVYSFQCDVHTLSFNGRQKWSLLYIIETWWDEKGKNVVRSMHWGRMLSGSKSDIIAWFRAQEEVLSA